MYNKTIIRFSFCDIQNNRGLSKSYQPQPSTSVDDPYLNLDYSGYHKSLQQLFNIISKGWSTLWDSKQLLSHSPRNLLKQKKPFLLNWC